MLLPNLSRRKRRQRQRMYAARLELVRKRGIDAALAFDARESFEAFRNDADIEVRLTARARTGMSGVLGAFILDEEFVRFERRRQFLADRRCDHHGTSVSRLRRRKSSNTFALYFRLSTP